MTRVYFLRHGEAGNKREWKGEDAARPLTAEGQQRLAAEADRMAELGLGIELIITSPFARAVQTAEIVARRLEMLDRLLPDPCLAPGFGTAALAQLLVDHPDVNTVMLVGHEPDLSRTICTLIGGGHVALEKGGLACIELREARPLRGELVWLVPPAVLVSQHGDW
jgi:phosphohistidine phosphatase